MERQRNCLLGSMLIEWEVKETVRKRRPNEIETLTPYTSLLFVSSRLLYELVAK